MYHDNLKGEQKKQENKRLLTVSLRASTLDFILDNTSRRSNKTCRNKRQIALSILIPLRMQLDRTQNLGTRHTVCPPISIYTLL